MKQSPRNGRLGIPAVGGLLAALVILTSCGRDITSPAAPDVAVLSGSVQASKDREQDKRKDHHVTLAVDLAGNGTGMVKSSPKGIACGGKAERGHGDDHGRGDKGKREDHDDRGENCHESYRQGDVVTLTAHALGRSVFVGWTGPCAESDLTGATCTVTMDADKSVTATFSKNVSYALDVTTSGGTGTVTSSPAGIDCGATCTASYASGTVVTLTAQADIGLITGAWTGCDSNPTTDTCVVTMNGAKSVTVTFVTPPPAGDSYLLQVAVISGSGTVTWTPSAGVGGSLSAPGTLGSSTLAAGTTVTFTLTGSTASISGCTSVVGGVCTLTMDQAYNVAVIFDSTSGNLMIIEPATPPPPPVCDPLAGPCPPQVR